MLPICSPSDAAPRPLAAAPLVLALLAQRLPAGFPSPADDHLEGEIDLAQLLIERPAATFLMRVSGHSMDGAGILDGDYVVVDRSLEPRAGQVVVAVRAGEMTIKRLRRRKDGRLLLVAENPDYPPTLIEEDDGTEVWGVVVGVVRKLA
jgi:DNA polymerase V